jgi:hypothetical protein
VPTLILLPESGLIDRLIVQLEEGLSDNRLREDEDRLLAKLRALKKDLDTMAWDDEAAWSRLVRHHIERLNEVGAVVATAQGDGAGPTKH